VLSRLANVLSVTALVLMPIDTRPLPCTSFVTSMDTVSPALKVPESAIAAPTAGAFCHVMELSPHVLSATGPTVTLFAVVVEVTSVNVARVTGSVRPETSKRR